jgi:hypothetical protein
MERLQFALSIHAPADTVYDRMLGLSDRSTYEQWTAVFNATSTFVGGWQKGAKIYFVGTDEQGVQGGMVAIIEENIPGRFVSIRHIGLLIAGEEVTEGPEVEKWAGGLENYRFEESNVTTSLLVELDTTAEFMSHMREIYPRALNKLKEICEE